MESQDWEPEPRLRTWAWVCGDREEGMGGGHGWEDAAEWSTVMIWIWMAKSDWVFKRSDVYYCRNGSGSGFCREKNWLCFSGAELRRWQEMWQELGFKSFWEALFSSSQSKQRQACFHCCPGKYLVIIAWFVVLLNVVGWLDLLENKLCSDT